MPGPANVESIDALRAFRAALIKYAEEAGAALAEAMAEMNRAQHALQHEFPARWERETRRCERLVSEAEERLRSKRMFRDASGRIPPAVEEEKALRVARQMLDHARTRLEATRRWERRIVRETELYRGGVQAYVTAVTGTLPEAASRLGAMVAHLEAYVAEAPAGVEPASSAAATDGAAEGALPSVARAAAPAQESPAAGAGEAAETEPPREKPHGDG